MYYLFRVSLFARGTNKLFFVAVVVIVVVVVVVSRLFTITSYLYF